jgi:hypothetical protein
MPTTARERSVAPHPPKRTFTGIGRSAAQIRGDNRRNVPPAGRRLLQVSGECRDDGARTRSLTRGTLGARCLGEQRLAEGASIGRRRVVRTRRAPTASRAFGCRDGSIGPCARHGSTRGCPFPEFGPHLHHQRRDHSGLRNPSRTTAPTVERRPRGLGLRTAMPGYPLSPSARTRQPVIRFLSRLPVGLDLLTVDHRRRWRPAQGDFAAGPATHARPTPRRRRGAPMCPAAHPEFRPCRRTATCSPA